jgi:hypothetical protein
VSVGRYLTPDTIQFGIVGVAVGATAGAAWWAAGRVRWGACPFIIAFAVAGALTNGINAPQWGAQAVVGGLLTLMACFGGRRLPSDLQLGWGWTVAGALASAVAVWAAVPETTPAVLAGACLTGVALSAAATRSVLSPAAASGMAAVIGWAALSGAEGRPWAAVGGVLCVGVAPWFALKQPLFPTARTVSAGTWLLGAHAALAVTAARWSAVDQNPGWLRVMAVGMIGMATAAVTRRQLPDAA